jgi:hypothetical protein
MVSGYKKIKDIVDVLKKRKNRKIAQIIYIFSLWISGYELSQQ